MKTDRVNRILAAGIALMVGYIVYDALRLPPELKSRLAPLSSLARDIGAVCHNDGDGEWIDSFVKVDGKAAVAAALAELAAVPDAGVSGCARSHMRRLGLAEGGRRAP